MKQPALISPPLPSPCCTVLLYLAWVWFSHGVPRQRIAGRVHVSAAPPPARAGSAAGPDVRRGVEQPGKDQGALLLSPLTVHVCSYLVSVSGCVVCTCHACAGRVVVWQSRYIKIHQDMYSSVCCCCGCLGCVRYMTRTNHSVLGLLVSSSSQAKPNCPGARSSLDRRDKDCFRSSRACGMRWRWRWHAAAKSTALASTA